MLLLTRPYEDSHLLASSLREKGWEVALDPMLKVVPLTDVSLDLKGIQAILVTSKNGVRCLAALIKERSLPLLTVGDKTAQEAFRLGFSQVESAQGNSKDLARLVMMSLPSSAALLHVHGDVVAGDLKGDLRAYGFKVTSQCVYESLPSSHLKARTKNFLIQGKIKKVLFFSPRTAEIFSHLAWQEGLFSSFKGVQALALSPQVAQKLIVLPWQEIKTSLMPDEASLLALL